MESKYWIKKFDILVLHNNYNNISCIMKKVIHIFYNDRQKWIEWLYYLLILVTLWILEIILDLKR